MELLYNLCIVIANEDIAYVFINRPMYKVWIYNPHNLTPDFTIASCSSGKRRCTPFTTVN